MARLVLLFVAVFAVKAILEKDSYNEDEVLHEVGKALEDENIAKNIREHLDTSLNELGFDSLAQKEIVINVEERFKDFGVEISDDEEKHLKTIRDFMNYIIHKLREVDRFNE